MQPKQGRKRVNRNQQRSESDDDNSDGLDSDDPDHSVASDHQDGYQNFVYRRQTPCVCRINFLKPDSGDLWYLRLLLYHVPVSSWADIRTVNNVVHPTHQSAAQARGLLQTFRSST